MQPGSGGRSVIARSGSLRIPGNLAGRWRRRGRMGHGRPGPESVRRPSGRQAGYPKGGIAVCAGLPGRNGNAIGDLKSRTCNTGPAEGPDCLERPVVGYGEAMRQMNRETPPHAGLAGDWRRDSINTDAGSRNSHIAPRAASAAMNAGIPEPVEVRPALVGYASYSRSSSTREPPARRSRIAEMRRPPGWQSHSIAAGYAPCREEAPACAGPSRLLGHY